MAFDSQTRNKLQRMVGACRRLLTDEFDDQLQGLYGIYAQDGRVLELEKLTTLDDDDYQIATLLRDRVKHLTSGMTSEKQPLAEAVRRVLREQAFTVLNRFAALRMAEERGFVQECVGQGLKSKGFQVFETVARSGLGGAYERYVTFIHGMFDELSLDLGVLFDRWSPFGLLFPREPALLKFFDLLNDPELKPLWKEDETVGWIYQYFNDEAERKKMREESAAPRNSRELAVRNQFFTPRYVVEFLTDNTLGRIWYEMTQGVTRLKEQCRYLVRRPNEIFLDPCEAAPAQKVELGGMDYEKGTAAKSDPHNSSLITHNSKAPTQEELLRQPVHIPHRPIKDPRTILMLDPACGSMHFGLYAFDLFEVIYEEAWELEKRGAEFQSRPPGMLSLQETYGTKEDFLKDVPRLIIEHNLHGIDIDPRCAQIAGLGLWLRAQKAWQRLGLKPTERPPIKRSNIVCAEPMPGEKELLGEFVEREFPAEERGVVLRLLETIFEKMQLAGEAGSLLKIEEEIRSAIEDARRQWQTARQRPEFFDSADLAKMDKRAGAQQELPAAERASMAADLRSLTSEDFWRRVEERIYAALRDYAEQAENGGGFQRRLFAEDAARGFAFIDVCRKRYEVTVMNPPFGELSKGSKAYLFGAYPLTKNDLFACFTERWAQKATSGGRVGAITSRSGFFFSTFQAWREDVLLAYAKPVVLADLGYGVLDSAMVETAAYVLEVGQPDHPLFCFRLLKEEGKAERLSDASAQLGKGKCSSVLHVCIPSGFRRIPGAPFAYWVGQRVMRLFADFRPFAGNGRKACGGIGTTDDFRFIRCWWEVPPTSFATSRAKALDADAFVPIALGGQTSRFYAATTATVKFGRDGLELKTFIEDKLGSASRNVRGQEFYFRPGLTWPLRGEVFSAWPVPAGCVFSVAGKIATTENETELPYLLGLFNSLPFDFLVGLSAGKIGGIRIQHQSGLIDRIPFKECGTTGQTLALLARKAWEIKWRRDTSALLSHAFILPALLQVSDEGLNLRASRWAAQVADGDLEIENIQRGIDSAALEIYGLEITDVRQGYDEPQAIVMSDSADSEDEPGEEADVLKEVLGTECMVASLVDYVTGSAFGRWDIRYATGERASSELPDPFAPLPVCPPGQLQNAQGLPATPEDVPAAYPIRIPWDGILVDDPNNPLDIERRVREVIEIIWKDRAEAIEHEACEILGVKSLRDYFRKPAGFFAGHLKRYSKSRRQAPIYWPLSTASGSYTLWIYYHRLTDQTLFQCVNDFVKPKLEEVMKDELRIMKELEGGASGSVHNSSLITHNSKSLRQKLEELTDLKQDLQDFQAELLRVAGLPYKPNLNDGVLITASPLWKLFRLPKWQKDLKACWAKLEAGDYDWAHLAYTIWPDRVKQVCKKDRSIAIAHGLEHLCEVKAPEKKAKRGKKKSQQMELHGETK